MTPPPAHGAPGVGGLLPAVVVGSGWARHAARALRARGDVSLCSVVGRGSSRTARLAEELGVRASSSIEDAVGSADRGIAVVAVDEARTPALARELITRGWHVLCAHPVARTSSEVDELEALARAHGVRVGTDYTFSTVEALQRARLLAVDRGPVIRIAVDYPGRLLPMALHLADTLAGPIVSVLASRAHPAALQVAVARSPAAFPAALLVEHSGGCVTSLVSMPHAEPAVAFRCRVSLPSMRLDLDLPLGRLVSTSLRRSGVRVETLVEGRLDADPFGSLMRGLVDAFVGACRSGAELPCPLDDDARVRRVWAVLGEAARCGHRVFVSKTTIEAD